MIGVSSHPNRAASLKLLIAFTIITAKWFILGYTWDSHQLLIFCASVFFMHASPA